MVNFCPDCFHDRSLSAQLVKVRPRYPDEAKCDFHSSKKGIPAEYVAGIVDGAFRANYGWADPNPYLKIGDPLDIILADLVGADDERVLAALKSALADTESYDFRDGGAPFYDDTQNFVRYESTYNPFQEMWDRFKFDIAHRQRFFNKKAENWLEQIFSDLHHQLDQSGNAPIYTLSPPSKNVTIYRARRLDDKDERQRAVARPDKHLAAPPERLRKAGRLNASGVCCFYGAFDLETCMSELRPPVGSFVVSAAFELIKPITVLDMTQFSANPKNRSVFSPVRQKRQDQWRFMQLFSSEITQPILPDDEVFDYIPTQAVAEFVHVNLAGRLGSAVAKIDGIIYQSAQRPGGRNIALFGDAALVEEFADDSGEESGMSKAELSRMWDDEAGYVQPSFKSFCGPSPSLRCEDANTTVHKITGAEIAHESLRELTGVELDI